MPVKLIISASQRFLPRFHTHTCIVETRGGIMWMPFPCPPPAPVFRRGVQYGHTWYCIYCTYTLSKTAHRPWPSISWRQHMHCHCSPHHPALPRLLPASETAAAMVSASGRVYASATQHLLDMTAQRQHVLMAAVDMGRAGLDHAGAMKAGMG